MIIKSVLGVGLVAAFGVTMALARPRGPQASSPEDRPPVRPGPRIVAALDVDRDGEISADELSHAAESLLTLDENGDGKLVPDEIGRGPTGGPGHSPPPVPMHLDVDGDGLLSLDEFLAPAKDHFQHIDSNGDGVIDEEEAIEARPPPMPRHGPHGPKGAPRNR